MSQIGNNNIHLFRDVTDPGPMPVEQKPGDGGKANGKVGGVAVNNVKAPVLKGADAPPPKDRVAKADGPRGNAVALANQIKFARVPDRDGMIAVAGEPKQDRKFLGLTIHKMSTGYKALLGQLDRYAQTADKVKFGGPINVHDVENAVEDLGGLEKLANKYDRSAKHTHRDEVAALKTQIAEERGILNRIKAQIDGLPGGKLPDGMTLRDAIEGMRGGGTNLAEVAGMFRPDRRGGTDFQPVRKAPPPPGSDHPVSPSGGASVDQPSPKVGFSSADSTPKAPGELTGKEMAKYVDAGITQEQAKFLHARGFGPADGAKIVAEYKRLNVPMTDRTIVRDLHDGNRRGDASKLGNGAFNTVYKIDYQRTDGTAFTGVFKAEAKDPKAVGWAGSRMGIKTTDPQLGCRNITAMVTNKLLGWKVVPNVEFGIHEGKLGIVMELAPGKTRWKQERVELTDDVKKKLMDLKKATRDVVMGGTYQAQLDKYIMDFRAVHGVKIKIDDLGDIHGEKTVGNPIDYKNPDVRRELVKLQWLDGINAQGDRHGGNYLVGTDATGKVVVTGIDNDQAEGVLIRDASQTKWAADDAHRGYRGCGWPPIADTDMYNAVMNLKAEDIWNEHRGLLTDMEISAKVARMQNAQKHMETLAAANMIIPADRWGGLRADDALAKGRGDSYVGRDQ